MPSRIDRSPHSGYIVHDLFSPEPYPPVIEAPAPESPDLPQPNSIEGPSVPIQLRAQRLLRALDNFSGDNSREGFIRAYENYAPDTDFESRYGQNLEAVVRGAVIKRTKLQDTGQEEFTRATGISLFKEAELRSGLKEEDQDYADVRLLLAKFFKRYYDGNHKTGQTREESEQERNRFRNRLKRVDKVYSNLPDENGSSISGLETVADQKRKAKAALSR